MSAFVCEHDLFDALATYAKDKRISYWSEKQKTRVDMSNASETALTLFRENVRSVNHRYNETDEACGYKYVPYFKPVKAVQIMKACDCLNYQSCETDDYEESDAYHMIEAIRAAAIRELPGYEDAKWGMPENPQRSKSKAAA